MEDFSTDINQQTEDSQPMTTDNDPQPAVDQDETNEDKVGGDDDNDDDNNDDDDDTDSTMDLDNDNDANATVVSPQEAERLLLAAVQLKEQGNAHFGKAERDPAVRCYRRALHRLKNIVKQQQQPNQDALDPQVASLWVTTATNLATVLFQQAKYQAAVQAASQALDVAPSHVKALYRRAVAQRKLGKEEQAVNDLQTALTVQPNHVTCRKELRAMQVATSRAVAQHKKALSKAFSGAVSLYDDKQGRKATTSTTTTPTAEELVQQQKQAWEDECVARMTRQESAISFDEWQKEQEEKQKQAQQEKQKREAAERKKQQEERKKRQAEMKKQQTSKTASDASGGGGGSSSSDEELTEAELQALRGYKKTKDGRVTSYFTREISDEEKARLAMQGPQKLSTTSTATNNGSPASNVPTPLATTTAPLGKKKGPSAWNRAGTWEEKDCTAWCTEHLKQCLLQTHTVTYQIVQVDSLTGDASIVWTKGKQRHVYDFHVTLHYLWASSSPAAAETLPTTTTATKEDTDEKKKKAKGVVQLPEISSTSTQEGLEVQFESWKRAPASQDDMAQALAERPTLEQALRQAIQGWLQDFHEHYRAHG